ncbi:MAG: pyridoxamine 5'-phosphate oxidase family protein [Acidobacteria bacterium]|nr:pyridoxamine 5'-phosphate oxidase family protein [Acidobacteriota bacterium]
MKLLRDLVNDQYLAVLATRNPDGLHGSLVAFAASPDLRELVFVTNRATRKYANLQEDCRVVLVMDNRHNEMRDFTEAAAVTVYGGAEEVTGPGREELERRFIAKHAHLNQFATAPSCAVFRVRVQRYSLVRRFQEVTDVVIEP